MALALALAAVVSVTAAAWFVHLARGPSASSAMVESRDDLPNAAPPTVRVQPFEALGTDTEETLLARAVTADLVTDLSKVAALSVVTAEKPGNDGAASGGLQARYVLSGTVQRDGNRLRLNVLLADARAGRQVWSERFDADDKDLWRAYRAAYNDEPFVRIVKERTGIHRTPDPRLLAGTNVAEVGFERDPHGTRVVATCALDNITKGAAGMAVQDLNIAMGWDETLGLSTIGLYPYA